jgi:hypothetical protein
VTSSDWGREARTRGEPFLANYVQPFHGARRYSPPTEAVSSAKQKVAFLWGCAWNYKLPRLPGVSPSRVSGEFGNDFEVPILGEFNV